MSVISNTPSPKQVPSEKSTAKITTNKDVSAEKITKIAQERIMPQIIEAIKRDMDLERSYKFLNRQINSLKSGLENSSDKEKRNEKINEKLIEILEIKKKLSESKIDYTNEENQFIKKALQFMAFPPEIQLSDKQKVHLFKQSFHVGLKGSINEELDPYHTTYQGVQSGSYAKFRSQYALTLLKQVIESDKPIEGFKTLKEKEQLLNICKQRQFFSEYQELFDDKTTEKDLIINTFIRLIDELDDPQSSEAVTLENGDRSFIFPGGWSTHYISYEIRKTNAGDYEFIIHNRGGNSDDERFHGNINKKIGEKTYSRTRVPIRISKDVLQDRTFLYYLVTYYQDKNSNGQMVYNDLYEYLIVKGKGQIIVSEKEKQIEFLSKFIVDYRPNEDDKVKIEAFIDQLIKEDPNFHSRQLYGTCGESNLTTTEKWANASVQRALKFYTLAGFVEEIKRKYLTGKREPLKTKDTIDALNELEKQLPKDSPLLENVSDLKSFIYGYNLINDIEADKAKDKFKEDTQQYLIALFKVIESIPDPENREKAKLNFESLKSLEDFNNFISKYLNVYLTDKSLYSTLVTIIQKNLSDMEDAISTSLNLLSQSSVIKDKVKTIMKQFKSLNNKIPHESALVPYLHEIHEHLIRAFEIDKKFEVHIGKKISSLRKKIVEPPVKKKINTQEISKIIEKAVIEKRTSLLEKKPSYWSLTDYLTVVLQECKQKAKELVYIKAIPDKDIKLNGLKTLRNECAKDLDVYQKEALLLQQSDYDVAMKKYTASLEQYKITIENDSDKNEKLILFEKTKKPQLDKTSDLAAYNTPVERYSELIKTIDDEIAKV
ncbi:MAG: hypothetical protein H0W88_04060 [Parachlamydiaceae bacterium]|nr:hypothetical protein [Parachlamydiaceae bacterium]